jgi:hypothetical protein
MTFEEMQTILAGIIASQDRIQETIEADRQARVEAHSRHELEMAQIRNQNAETAAIANSNARAIEATANQQAHDREIQANTQRQLVELAQIVRQISESSDRRLTALEDRQ